MEIRGRLVATDSPTTLPVAIVSIGHKQIGVAVIVATFPDGMTDNVEIADQSLALLAITADRQGFFGNLHKVELGTETGAMAQIEMTLACADDGDTIVFMCADRAIFDIAWRALNVRK